MAYRRARASFTNQISFESFLWTDRQKSTSALLGRLGGVDLKIAYKTTLYVVESVSSYYVYALCARVFVNFWPHAALLIHYFVEQRYVAHQRRQPISLWQIQVADAVYITRNFEIKLWSPGQSRENSFEDRNIVINYAIWRSAEITWSAS